MTTASLSKPAQSSQTKRLLISSDSHVTEDPNLWQERLPAHLRDQAPKFPKRTPEEAAKFHPGGWDPHERVKEMDQDGVSAELFYGGFGSRFLGIKDAEMQEAGCRVYNDWLMEFCSVAPDRLIGIPQIALYNIDHAVAELERCKKGGMVGSSIWLTPDPVLPFSSSHYEPFWAASQDLEMPVTVHLGTGFGYNLNREYRGGVQRYRENVNHKILQFEDALFDFIFFGVLDRHPRLKLVLAEPEIGWAPFVLQMWDYHFERFHKSDPLPINNPPSFYFNRQVSVTFINDNAGTRNLTWWGVDNCMWSSDYPHPPSPWPHSRDLVEKQLGNLPEEDQKKILSENVIKVYGLKRPQPVA
jgi:predicted TIM-barrel fold metal-dependent hydrolase